MTNFGWDLPPGVFSIPGDHDMTASYSITFPFIYFNDDQEDHTQVIAESIQLTDYTLDMDTLEVRPDGSYRIYITYEDDLDLDPRDMDMLDIEETIIRYLNETYHLNIDPRDDTIEFDIDIHR